MPLSQQQIEQLHKMTRNKVHNWEISGWLMGICGLSFKEAYEERHKANEEIERQPVESIREVIREETTQKTEDEAGGASPIQFENSEEEKIESPIDNSCISCGNIDATCDCPVKTVAQIPF